MGLDMTAYSTLAPTKELSRPPDDRVYKFSPNPSFPKQFEGLPEDEVWCYGDTIDFRAGSYSGYGEWRRWLCQLAFGVPPEEVWKNPGKWADYPLSLLINFTDCDGEIGPVASAKIAEAMRAMRPTLEEGQDDHNVYKFDLFLAAFTIAARGGVVIFH